MLYLTHLNIISCAGAQIFLVLRISNRLYLITIMRAKGTTDNKQLYFLKHLFMLYTPGKCADLPVHPRSVCFVVGNVDLLK